MRITRTRYLRSRTTRETAYLIVTLPHECASAAELNLWARQEWTIENKSHWVRDRSFGEDHSTSRTGHGPVNLATLRSAVKAALKNVGYLHIPEGRRDHTTVTETLYLHGLI